MGMLDLLMAQRMQQDRLQQQKDLALWEQQQQAAQLQQQQQAFGSATANMGMKPNDAAVLWQLTQAGPQGRQMANDLWQGAIAQSPAAKPPAVGAPSFSDFTPESIAEYQQSGDPRTLRYRPDVLGQQRIDLAVAKENRLRAAQGRPPVGQLEAMVQDESLQAGYEAMGKMMRSEYFGYVSGNLADAVKEVADRFGGQAQQPFVGFWNQMESQQAERRHALFGATLTEGEQTAWNKIAIRPSDTYESARAKLEAQQRMIERRQQVRQRVLGQQGYGDQGQPDGRPPLSSFGGP